MTAFQAEDSRLEGVEMLGQSPYTETLWCLDFVCVLEGSERHFSIYTKRWSTGITDDEMRGAIAASGACDGALEPPKISGLHQFPID